MTILLTGGSGCGKSSFAERLCLRFSLPRYYIAAMRPFGPGGAEKVARHRAQRAGKGFQTIERYRDLEGLVLPGRGTALLECVGTLTSNEMFDDDGGQHDPVGPVLAGIAALERQCDNLILVTNEVGCDGGRYGPGTLDYIAALGGINARLARRADVVCELVCGIPLPLKGELPE